VEATLLSHPDVREATVIDWEAAPGDKRLAAYVVIPDGDPQRAVGLRPFLAEKLPDYMIPSVIVLIDALPVNSNGKIDRKALPAPDLSLAASANEYVAPRTPLEEQLGTLWCEVLGVARVGVHDDFFALGGHSLLAVRLVAAIGRVLRVPVPLAELFQTPTIAGLAVRIDELRASGLGNDLPTIPRASRESPVPLSFAQERFWFVHQLAAGTPILNLHIALPVSGALNVAAFRQTIQDVVQRHESLRTTFVETAAGQAVQVVAPTREEELPVEDLSGLPEAERCEQVSARSREQASAPFDLSRAPLFRLRLLRCGDDEHVLLVTTTHMVFDGWSLQVLVREVAEIYDARHAGRAPSLPALPVQYADYSTWQRQYLQGEVMAALLGYWRGQLADLPVLDLPTDHPRQVGAQGGKRWHRFHLAPVLTARVSRLCAAEGATPYMLMLAAFQLLLQRYSESDDVPVATPVANRRQAETHGMIGLFVNTVIMRADLSGNPTFRELLARVRRTALDAFAHQELPFERLVEELHPERDLTRHPLAQVLFNFLQRADRHRRPQRRELVMGRRPSEEDGVSGLFDLTLSLVEGEHGYQSALQYDTRLFEADTVERMAGHFRNLLEQIVAHPEWTLSQFNLLDEDEQRVLVEDWNRTEADFPRELCAHQLFEEQVRRTPNAVAVISGDARMTYRELNARANCLAHRLRRLGVCPDEPVAMCVERSLAVPVALLGILKAGSAFLPLDPELPPERMQYMLRDAAVRFLVVQGEADLAWRPEEVVCIPIGCAEQEDGDVADPVPTARPDSLAYAIYTSGSTGRPKGVLVEHCSLVNVIASFCRSYQLGPIDRVLHNTSISFDVAINEILPALSVGAAVVLSGREERRDLSGLSQLVRRQGVTVLAAAPTALARLNELPDPLPGVRLILSGGEALSRSDVDRLPATAVVVNGYGPTETTICATCHVLSADATEAESSLPIGKPLANYKAYVLDRHLHCVPVGCPGELCLGGVGLARGYLGDPELTAAKFVPNPFVPGERIYHTGDRARWLVDGNIEFLGRIDRQVKIRGHRIKLGEVEAALLCHPDVREATVIDWEAAPGDKRLVAYVAIPDAGPQRVAGLRLFVAEKLPDYMVPSAIVPLDALPVNSNGKIDRKALPAPDLSPAASANEYVAPRTPLEEQLSTLWCEVLGVDRIGVDDDFFARGGHSLLAVRLVSLMSDALDTPVSLAEFFQAPTIAGLSERLTAADAERQAFSPPPTAGPGLSSFTLETVPGCVSLVRLADGPSGRPVFIMPGLGGLVFGFLPLAARLAAERPVYALQGQGLVPGQHAHESYADMARLYIEEIRTVQPHGPYLLVGWSIGGMVAVEAAQQLRAAGQETALVAMLDAHVFQPKILPGFVAEAAVMRWLAPLVGIPARELAGLVAKEKWGEISQRLGLPEDSGGEQVRCLTAVCRADLHALRSYKPAHYSGSTVLLHAAERRRAPGRRERRLFPELHCEQVAGNHYSILREPHVDALVVCLQKHLKGIAGAENEGH